MRRPPDIQDARAAWWTWRAVRSARGQLRAGAVREVRLPAPPGVPPRAARAIRLVLRREHPSCLERALVLQRWLSAQGIARDVVVGTHGGPRSGFMAHAWIDGEPQADGLQYTELIRLSP
jgi:hypothetical protein